MRVIKTHVPVSIVTADGGQWICTCVNVDGEQIEVRAPIRSVARLLEQVTYLALPVLRQEEQQRREDSAACYEVAMASIHQRKSIPSK